MKLKRIFFYAGISLLRNWVIYGFCILLYLLTAFTFRYSDAKISEITNQIDNIYRTEPIYAYAENQYDTGISVSFADGLCSDSNIERYYYQKNIYADAHLRMPGYPNYAPPKEPSDLPRFSVVCINDISNYVLHNAIVTELSSEWNDSSVLISKDLAEFNGLTVGDTIQIQYYRQGGTAYKECTVSGTYDSDIENNLTMYVSLSGFRDFINTISEIEHSHNADLIDKAVFKVIDNHMIDETRIFLEERAPETYQINIDDDGFVKHMTSLTKQRGQAELFSVIIKIGLSLCSICFTAWIIHDAFRDIQQLWTIGCRKNDVMKICAIRYSIFFIICGIVIQIIGHLPLAFVLIFLSNYCIVIISSLAYIAAYYHDRTWRKL